MKNKTNISLIDRLDRVYSLVDSLATGKIDKRYFPVARKIVKRQIEQLSEAEKGKIKGMLKMGLPKGKAHLGGIVDTFCDTAGKGMRKYDFSKKYSGALASFEGDWAGRESIFSGEYSGMGAIFA